MLFRSTNLTASNFTFKMGTTTNKTTWVTAPNPSSVNVFPGAGVNGSTRIELIWPAATIRNTWLQVTMNANANTGLASPDVFYFGNLVGDTMNSGGTAAVTGSDILSTRAQLAIYAGQTVPIDSTTDFNRDGHVTGSDVLIARAALPSGITLQVIVS